MSRKRGISLTIYFFDIAALVVMDQLVKLYAIRNLQGQPERPLIQGFLHLTYLENTGAAFGFLAGFDWAQIVLTVFKLVVLAAAGWYFFKLPNESRFTLLRVPLVLVIAGGIGNLIDRVRFGHVVDMFVFRFINFPVFNVADIYVTTGIFLFAIMILFVVKDAPYFGYDKTKLETQES
ncbi:MAG: signal peptidase II [Defluviitaleaceae bacterium]|nr:signal peptidase II [Defluviitaleaceae bacterium]